VGFDDTASHCRQGTTARKMMLERVENAKCGACPERRTKIKRHPGNLVFPLSKIVRHDPTRAHVTEALERFQKLAAMGQPRPAIAAFPLPANCAYNSALN
jgi:hypothetical protein